MPPSITPLQITPEHARRFTRRAVLLDTPAPDIATALAHHGYIQIDPINVCGRMHDLILRNRVAGYREGDLHDFIHSPARPGFEHYFPHDGILVAFPAEAWPYLSPLIASRRLRRGPAYRRKLGPKHEALARHILAEIAARGPLTSDDIEHEGRSRTGWGTPGRLVKNLLEVMLVHGRVLIAGRRNFRRVYDLPERVLPSALLNAPGKSAAETARWTALLRLRQRRLAALKRGEFELVSDLVQRIELAGVKTPPLYILQSDLPLLETCHSGTTGQPSRAVPRNKLSDACHPEQSKGSNSPTVSGHDSEFFTPFRMTGKGAYQQRSKESTHPLLLAPLDPLVYDRRVTSALWGFNYTWEVYTPPHKRQRGYYALPVLAGVEIVGHVDPKADRSARRLRVMARSIRRGHKIAPAVAELARWLGLR